MSSAGLTTSKWAVKPTSEYLTDLLMVTQPVCGTDRFREGKLLTYTVSKWQNSG